MGGVYEHRYGNFAPPRQLDDDFFHWAGIRVNEDSY
jgi:hypothetical protein